MEVRDLWPESIKTVGAMNDNAFIRYFEWEELRCYKSAKKIIVVTEAFKHKLINRGIEESKIGVVKNGVDRSLFSPQNKDCELIKSLGLEGKKVIGYIGTHGMAHKLDFILNCAKELEVTNPKIHFILLGDGAERENLIRLKNELCLRNVTMLESVSKKDVKRYISILDLCLINLRKSELFTTVIPSKIFENAGMEIPIFMGVKGEAQELIEEYGAGICYEPEDKEDFMRKLDIILTADIYQKCKEGCRKLSIDFDRKKLSMEMLSIIENTLNE